MTLRRNIVPTFVIFVYKYNKPLDLNVNVQHPFYLFNRQYSQVSNQDYKRYCSILRVPENSSANDIHNAFIKLAKRFHPDSGHEEANAEKFKEIETAFRMLKNHPNTTKVDEIEKATEKDDIKHVTPQHRQYLSFDGVGTGSPYQRQQEYTKRRAMQAADNVLQHRLNKSSVQPEDKKLKKNDNRNYRHNHKIKTKYGIDRIVEDLIQESMSKGEFNNLPGSGKPLKLNQNFNPYVDFTTHKLNQVLIENGFTPEWITLQKDIREDIKKLKIALAEDRKMFKTIPLTDEDERRWEKSLEKYHDTVNKINKKIQNYNLVVPILQKQMVTVNIKKLADIGTQYRDNNDLPDISTNRLRNTYDYTPYAVYNPYYPLNFYKPLRPINPYVPYYSYPYYPILPYNPIQSYHVQSEITTNPIKNTENSTQVAQNMENTQYVGKNVDPIVSSVRINSGAKDININDQSTSIENSSVESIKNPTSVSQNSNDKNTQDQQSGSAAVESNSIENEILDVYVPVWIGAHSEYRYLEGPPLGINNF